MYNTRKLTYGILFAFPQSHSTNSSPDSTHVCVILDTFFNNNNVLNCKKNIYTWKT